MMLKTRIFTWSFLFVGLLTFPQMDNYNYKQNINGISDTWHSITLPNNVFAKVQSNLSDIRVYGITEENDTIEAPYILKIDADKIETTEISFDIINMSKTESGFYFTFKVNTDEPINQIQLDFDNANFDWNIQLEGSQNQQEWFTILEDYRLLSIKNENTDYSFTKLAFPESNYTYYRLFVKSETKPELKTASIFNQTVTKGTYNSYEVIKKETAENKGEKSTQLTIELEEPVSINSLKINVESDIDFYRYATIDYLADSIKTEKGWKYTYRNITSGTLNSLEDNTFIFPNTIAKTIRFTVYNYDNAPLTINSVEAKGNTYKLLTRFSEVANYKLVYGNKQASKPIYDITKFSNTIPADTKEVTLGKVQNIEKPEKENVSALFENQFWLWGIMLVIIILLGGFTLKMMRQR